MARSMRARRVLVVLTVASGAATAVLLTALVRPGLPSAAVNALVQLLMSVFIPFGGVLAVQGAVGDSLARMVIAIARSVLLAGGFALYGLGVSVLAGASVGLAPDLGTFGRLLLASVAVQVLAQLVGTGLGLLVRGPVLASALTVVVPLGVSVALTAIDPSGSLSERATPFGGASGLLALTSGAWPNWWPIAGVWGVGLNAFVLLRYERDSRAAPPL